MTAQPKPPSIPIACDLTAIPAAERDAHIAATQELFASVQALEELPDGYSFRFANAPGMFLAIARFVEYERRCCPFFTFTIQAEAGHGALWLRLTGNDEVKAFAHANFVLATPNP